MALTERLQSVADLTTAGVGATAKMTALVTGVVDLLIEDLSDVQGLTPNQQAHVKLARANLVANIEELVTAVGL